MSTTKVIRHYAAKRNFSHANVGGSTLHMVPGDQLALSATEDELDAFYEEHREDLWDLSDEDQKREFEADAERRQIEAGARSLEAERQRHAAVRVQVEAFFATDTTLDQKIDALTSFIIEREDDDR